jgi:hypothetical protein
LTVDFSGHSIESYGGEAGKVKLSRLQKIAICEGDYCWRGIKIGRESTRMNANQNNSATNEHELHELKNQSMAANERESELIEGK